VTEGCYHCSPSLSVTSCHLLTTPRHLPSAQRRSKRVPVSFFSCLPLTLSPPSLTLFLSPSPLSPSLAEQHEKERKRKRVERERERKRSPSFSLSLSNTLPSSLSPFLPSRRATRERKKDKESRKGKGKEEISLFLSFRCSQEFRCSQRLLGSLVNLHELQTLGDLSLVQPPAASDARGSCPAPQVKTSPSAVAATLTQIRRPP
jgi:hypothetical protein